MSVNPWSVAVPLVGVIIVLMAAWKMRRAIQERRSGFPLRDERTVKSQGPGVRHGDLRRGP